MYYINLDARKDRQSEMERMLGPQPHVRRPAMTPDDVRRMLANGTLVCKAKMVWHFESRLQFALQRSTVFSYAEIATTLSHLSTIRRVYESQHPLALILEDDVELARSRREVWERCAGWCADGLPLPPPLPRAPFKNSAPLWGGGVPHHLLPPPPPKQIFFRAVGQSNIFSGTFNANQFRPKKLFGAFGASKDSAPLVGGGGGGA